MWVILADDVVSDRATLALSMPLQLDLKFDFFLIFAAYQ